MNGDRTAPVAAAAPARPGAALKRQAGLLLALFAVVLSANVLSMKALFDQTADIAHLVNHSGELRYLSQLIAYRTARLDSEAFRAQSAEALPNLLERYEGHLAGLERRVVAAGLAAYVRGPGIDRNFAALRGRWPGYRAAVLDLLRDPAAPAARQARQAVDRDAAGMLADADRLTGALAETEGKLHRYIDLLVAGAVLADGLFIGFLYLRFRTRILRPLALLAEGVRRAGAGDLGVRLSYQFADELGELAASFNRSAGQVQCLVDELGRSKENLRLWQRAVESSVNAIVITDAAQEGAAIVYVNPAFETLTGYAEAEVLGRDARFLHRGDLEQDGLAEIRTARRERRTAVAELRNYRKDGAPFWNELRVAPVRDEAGRVTHFIGVLNDITERKRHEAELLHQAQYDALTNLPNRVLLRDRLSQAISAARRRDHGAAAIFLDLDHFKHINDSLGHALGDTLLQAVTARLAACLREEDTLSRHGGDEFVVLLPESNGPDDVATVVHKLQASLFAPFMIDRHEINISASLGIALYPKDGEDGETLLKNADAALYQAKDAGRNRCQFYAPRMNAHTLQRLELETGLRRAIERGELVLLYQPKVELHGGEVVGAEALLRWRHPTRGLVPPAEFVPLAEETGLIVPIGEWVVDTVCEQIRTWQAAGLPGFSVAINVSARQFHQDDLVRVVAQALRLNEVPPACLELELTESALMRDPERAAETLHELKALGVRLSLDDFGTGYSSLNYLKRFPIDTLKIDQSFIRDLTTDPDDAAIALTVIALARNMRCRVVAEGVETEGQLNQLRRHRCDEIQGFLFSHPLPAEEFAGLVRAGRRLPLAEAGPTQGQTLLLVDDEPSMLSALTRLFRRDGYRILTATNAGAALDLLARDGAQVIVCDQRMPGMGGTEFLSRVKELHPDTIRVMLTGYTELQSVTDAINHGAIYKFLTKPWDDDLLRGHIREAFLLHAARKGEGALPGIFPMPA